LRSFGTTQKRIENEPNIKRCAAALSNGPREGFRRHTAGEQGDVELDLAYLPKYFIIVLKRAALSFRAGPDGSGDLDFIYGPPREICLLEGSGMPYRRQLRGQHANQKYSLSSEPSKEAAVHEHLVREVNLDGVGHRKFEPQHSENDRGTFRDRLPVLLDPDELGALQCRNEAFAAGDGHLGQVTAADVPADGTGDLLREKVCTKQAELRISDPDEAEWVTAFQETALGRRDLLRETGAVVRWDKATWALLAARFDAQLPDLVLLLGRQSSIPLSQFLEFHR
jgi:hypothetical protein